eukprot:119144_1
MAAQPEARFYSTYNVIQNDDTEEELFTPLTIERLLIFPLMVTHHPSKKDTKLNEAVTADFKKIKFLCSLHPLWEIYAQSLIEDANFVMDKVFLDKSIVYISNKLRAKKFDALMVVAVTHGNTVNGIRQCSTLGVLAANLAGPFYKKIYLAG